MKLGKRIEALERVLVTEPAILVMEDGSRVKLNRFSGPVAGGSGQRFPPLSTPSNWTCSAGACRSLSRAAAICWISPGPCS